MDCRITLGRGESFLDFLIKAKEKNETVNLIIDADGLERIESKVQSISNSGNNVIVTMDDGRKLSVHQIVALNGIFHQDYGEC